MVMLAGLGLAPRPRARLLALSCDSARRKRGNDVSDLLDLPRLTRCESLIVWLRSEWSKPAAANKQMRNPPSPAASRTMNCLIRLLSIRAAWNPKAVSRLQQDEPEKQGDYR